MAIQSLILKNRKLAMWFMSSRKANFWEKMAEKRVLKNFQEVVHRVPAYKKFLKENNINSEDIKTIKDFKSLPIIDKRNYLQRYPIEDLCLDGKLSDKYLIDCSSGYSGTSLFWPRTREEDKDYPSYMKLAYEQFYKIHEKSTLMIITLALGTWVGGEKISWATREIAIRGKNPFTVITPGLNIKEIIEIVKYFQTKYEQIILVGYPPFIKTIIDEGEIQGIDWKKINLKIGLGGEGYSEDWREYIRKKIGLPENDFMGIAGGYGAADLGMSVGREYPISVLIRKFANQNRKLANDLFGEENIPSLCQYNPSSFYIEEKNNELIFSCLPGIPVIRYNIHDRGGVIPFDKAMEILRSYNLNPFKLLEGKGYTKRDIWQLPFFYIFGRSDGTVNLYGVNVYIENIKTALEQSSLARTNTGNFRMEAVFDKEFNQSLIIHIELISDTDVTPDLEIEYKKYIVQALERTNKEYSKLHHELGNKVLPEVKLYNYQQDEFSTKKTIKNIYIKK